MDNITQLYPLPAQERPLKGTYLAHQLRQYSQASGQAFVYGNFVTSERTWEMMHEDYGDNGAGLVAKLIQQSGGQDA